MRPAGLSYYGGKSPRSGRCKWISNIIGFDQDKSYIEPFGGMLGVMLSRPPVNVELVNDLNRWLYSWWLAVRDYPAEFARKIEATPFSRIHYDKARSDILHGNPTGDVLTDALTCHVLIEQSMTHGPSTNSGWSVMYSPKIGSVTKWHAENVKPLAKRLRKTQMECRDALDILERSASEAETVVYVDPPYRTANHDALRQGND